VISEIGAAGPNRPDGVFRGNNRGAEDAKNTGAEREQKKDTDTVVSSKLQGLVNRILAEGRVRPERIQQVKEKMQRGQLVTPDSVRNAAARLLSEEA